MKKNITYLFFLLLSFLSEAQIKDLNFYIEKAKTNSPLLNKIENNIKIIQAEKQKIKAILRKPVISIESNILSAPILSEDTKRKEFQWNAENTINYIGYDLALSNGGQYIAFLSANQPLFNKKRYNFYLENVNLKTKINENEKILTQHELEKFVTEQYILCEKYWAESQIIKNLHKELNKQIQITKALVKNAIYSSKDIMILQIELENLNLEYTKIASEYKKNLLNLNQLCGIGDTSFVKLKTTEIRIKKDTATQSYFLLKYKLDSLNILSQQNLFNLNYYPRLDFFANAGLNAAYLPTPNRFGFSFGIRFSWKIFDGDQKKIQNEISIIKLQNIEFEKKQIKKNLDVNKQKLLNQIKYTDQQISIVQRQLEQYRNLLKLYKIELQNGQISTMDIKNIIRDFYRKKQEYLNLETVKKLLIVSFNYWNF